MPRPAGPAARPGPHCARRPHGVTPRLRRAGRGPSGPGHTETSAPGTNPPPREPCLPQGTSAASLLPRGLARENTNRCSCPSRESCSPPASRCRSWSPWGSRSVENLISHFRQERWALPRCQPGARRLRWCRAQHPVPAGDRDRDSAIPAAVPGGKLSAFEPLTLTQMSCSTLALTLLRDSRAEDGGLGTHIHPKHKRLTRSSST